MAKTEYSVFEINNYIHDLVAEDFGLNDVTVVGELSNVNYNHSGHIYFTIKDEKSQLKAVIWRSTAARMSLKLVNGMKVKARGKIDVYAPYGYYQLVTSQIAEAGKGDLNERFEALKKKLEAEGLFAEDHKKPIPRYVMRLGIVTASTGAAVHDIIRVSKGRNPYVEIFLHPAAVQGEAAAPSIVTAIEYLDKMDLDVIIVGRGGGSMEDLWAFNEEIVARAIYAADTPIISGVGHEPDVTIADYVADRRAATPSNAAEIANFVYRDFRAALDNYMTRFNMAFDGKLDGLSALLDNYRLSLEKKSPVNRISMYEQKLPEYTRRLNSAMEGKLNLLSGSLPNYSLRMNALMNSKLDSAKSYLAKTAASLEGLSPLNRLSGGYSFVADKSGNRVSSVSNLKENDEIKSYFADGYVVSEVKEITVTDVN